jgi:hypothetical protein
MGNKEEHRTDKVISDRDDRISCYNSKHYVFEGIRAHALAWYIQFAIRVDVAASEVAAMSPASPEVQLSGLLELYKKRYELRELIRAKHIIDEPALETIGLTLYNFPTLSHFFVAPNKHGFVREATVRELLEEISYLHKLAGRLASLKNPRTIGLEEISPLRMVGQMAPSQIEVEADLSEQAALKERFLIVDMAAPVTVLKKQFLSALVRAKKQKLNSYDVWKDFAVLPYIDLKDWQSSTGLRIADNVRVNLLYGDHDGSSKRKEETTRHVERLLDMASPVSCGLKSAAAETFTYAITLALGDFELLDLPDKEKEAAAKAAAAEALDRWFPRSYPLNLPTLTRYARLYPEMEGTIAASLLTFDIAVKNCTMIERIQRTASDAQGGDAFLHVLRVLQDIEE